MKSTIRAFAFLMVFTFVGTVSLCGCAYPYEEPIVLTDHTGEPETDKMVLRDTDDPQQISSETVSESSSPASEEVSFETDPVSDVSSEATTSDVDSETSSDVPSEKPIDRTVPIDPKEEDGGKYVLNLSSRKIHLPECASAAKIAEDNKCVTDRSLDDLVAAGYTPCGTCMKDKTVDKTDTAKTDTGKTDRNPDKTGQKYVLNTSSKKIHLPDCSSVKRIAEKNYSETTDPQACLAQGYEACKICKPFG